MSSVNSYNFKHTHINTLIPTIVKLQNIIIYFDFTYSKQYFYCLIIYGSTSVHSFQNEF